MAGAFNVFMKFGIQASNEHIGGHSVGTQGLRIDDLFSLAGMYGCPLD